jgi:putative flippase GtrA
VTIRHATSEPPAVQEIGGAGAHRWRRQFVTFAGVGGIATAVQYVILFVAVRGLHWEAVTASCAGFAISAVLNYILNYRFTFRSTNAHSKTAMRFAVVTTAGLVLNGAIMFLLVHMVGIVYFVAQLLATAVVMVSNFLCSALWTFAASDRSS